MSMTQTPMSWHTVKLGEVAEFVMGQSPSSAYYNVEGKGLPFLQGKADFTDTFPKPTKYCTQSLKVAHHGDVLISVRAPVGDVNLADQDYIIGRGLASLRLTQGDEWFLFYMLQHYKKVIVAQGSGTTFQSINRAVLDNLVIHLPPLSEQRTIAGVLRSVQKGIESRKNELVLERERKAALMDHLFTYGTRGEPTKQTEIGEMPERWRMVLIGEIARLTSGGTPDRSKPEYWAGTIPWVKTGEIDYGVILDTEEKITQEGLRHSSAKIIPKGTLLMAMYGQGVTRGRVALLGIDAAINQACVAIHTDSRVDSGYLFNYLSYCYESIRNLGHGANQKNLNTQMIRSIAIPLPSLDEQFAIANVLTACGSKIAAIQREMRLLDELFRAILEELMTGRLSVSPLLEGGNDHE